MLSERRPLLEVFKSAKEKRGMVLTNLSFQRQLCKLAAREGFLGAKPEGYTDGPIEKIGPPMYQGASQKIAK